MTRKVLLVGTGNIARTHAAALREIPGASVIGVFDANRAAADAFARQFGGGVAVYGTRAEAAASDADVIHVLTPPDTHLAAALPFAEAGKAVLLEKPVGVSSAECRQLGEVSVRTGAVIGVNQNLAFNPAYLKLKQCVESGRLGRPRYLSYIYEAPLRQLSARQFGHWMFREPLNILLEQAVHPLSQIVDLAGPVGEIATLAEAPIEMSPGIGLHNACQVSLQCQKMPAHLRFHVGANFTVCRMTVVCDDGVAIADMFANQFHTLERSPYMEPIDGWLSARKTGRTISAAGFAVLRDYSLAMLKLKSRSDPFYLGMRGSLQSFYRDLDAARPPRIGLAFGAHLVEVCERIATSFKPLAARPAAAAGATVAPAGPLVAVLGGTGFIGSYTVAALLASGHRVRVMARGTANLQAVYYLPGVEVHRGDIKRTADVERIVTGTDYVVNLAHGGGGEDFAAIRAAMVDTAREVAHACHAAQVRRLVHVGSISGLYLGVPGEVITGATPPDPLPQTRNDYARAKALADAEVLKVGRESGLEVVLLRPGLVIGAGTSPFHGGLGFFNNDQYCVGWNDGRNPLPWVLVEDCANAIVAALAASAAAGKAYNLVGDVRPTAREYLAALAAELGRPLQFVASNPTGLWLTEMGKWAVKRVAGRKVGRPYRRDLLSRGLAATFECADAKRDLGWAPVAESAEFHRRAVAVHAENA